MFLPTYSAHWIGVRKDADNNDSFDREVRRRDEDFDLEFDWSSDLQSSWPPLPTTLMQTMELSVSHMDEKVGGTMHAI